MAFNQCFSEECKSIPSTTADSATIYGFFDCNICLEAALDPMVTLCGHLYCWSCIYKWFSLASNDPPKCPVCKAAISLKNMVPLYCHGQTPADATEIEGKAPSLGMFIPPRPRASGTEALITPSNPAVYHPTYQNPNQSQVHFSNTFGSCEDSLGVSIAMGVVHSVVFGNSESLNGNLNSYYSVGSRNLRLRRHERQVDKSLNRISIFFFCCLVICLLLF